MKREKSCGAVVFTRRGGTVQYLLVRSLSGSYGFPKGHMEAGESEHQTARREIREETGLEVAFVPGFRGRDSYRIFQLNVSKQVVYFLAEAKSLDCRFQETEISDGGFYAYEDALGLLKFEGARGILRDAHTFLSKILA